MARLPSHERGIAIIEMILVVATFMVVAMVFGNSIVGSEENAVVSGKRAKATAVAEEGIEAVRNMSDESFDALMVGSHGLSKAGNVWNFSGTSDVNSGFTRTVEVTDVDSSTKQVTVTVTWQQSALRTGSVQVTEKMTKWREAAPLASYFEIDFTMATLSGDNKEIRNVLFKNNSNTTFLVTEAKYEWDVAGSEVERMRIENVTVWSKVGPGTPVGAQVSGTWLDMTDFTIPANSQINMDNLKFTKSMDDATVTMTIKMQDGSEYSTTRHFVD